MAHVVADTHSIEVSPHVIGQADAVVETIGAVRALPLDVLQHPRLFPDLLLLLILLILLLLRQEEIPVTIVIIAPLFVVPRCRGAGRVVFQKRTEVT